MIALDGKTLRRSFEDAARSNPLAVVTAFASARRLVVGQHSYRVAEGDSEVLAARALLECLDLTGHLVTADALHCQEETARTIRARGGDYLLRLKGNHPALHAMVQEYFADPALLAGLASSETTDADHGRIETRRAWVCHDLDWLRGPKTAGTEPVLLPDMACLGRIETTVEHHGTTTVTRHFHLSSRALTAAAYLEAARAHWAVENRLHWGLDVVFDEDRARTRKGHGPENLATLRKLALNILNRARPDISVRRKRKRSGWSDEFARSILGQMR